MAMPYDIPIIGYKNECINTLRIWKSEIPTRDFGNYHQMPKVNQQVTKMH